MSDDKKQLMHQILAFTKESGASDLHLSAGCPPIFRLNGTLVPSKYPALSHDDIKDMIFELLTKRQKKNFVDNWELDCSYAYESVGRFRCNVFMQSRGMGAVFRLIPAEVLSMDDLSIPAHVKDVILNNHQGLILVTGPTGSGKSTTLAAMINEINRNKHEHIITIEDPIEFMHSNNKSLVNQREVSTHTKSFKNALRAALREDPDVILVGELRDFETIKLALEAAETGHLVFGTLHTNSAAKTINRMIDVFPDMEQAQTRAVLSENLKMVFAQTLLKTADKKGRVGAFEILINNNAVANLIRESKTHQIPSAMQTGSQHGMITFEKHISSLMNEGLACTEDGNKYLGIKNKGSKADHLNGSTSSTGSPTAKVTPTHPGATVTPSASATEEAVKSDQPQGADTHTGFSLESLRKKKAS